MRRAQDPEAPSPIRPRALPRAPGRQPGPGLALLLGLLLAAGCGPTLKQAAISREAVEAERARQREIAFATFMARQDRLRRVADPLLVAARELCGSAVRPLYGFLLHDRPLYARVFGPEYEGVAARHFGLGEGIQVRYVHPDLAAAAAGLRAGDRVVAINGEPVGGRSAVTVMEQILDQDATAPRPLTLEVERDGRRLELVVPGVPACAYPVQLVNHDAVNAFADGRRVGITTGMVRFAETDEELALVVAHEVAHNALGHLTKRFGNVMLGTLVDLALSVLGGVNTQGTFGRLGELAYSQAFEAEADYAGLYIVARAGYDIRQAPNFWRRMAVEHPGSIRENFMATHPSTPERFLAIEQAVREIEAKRRQGLPLLPDRKP